MKVDGRPYRSIWLDQDGLAVVVIDQTRLPHSFGTRRLNSVEDAADAIKTMVVRGAPLIGATAAYGLALALADDPGDANLESAITLLSGTRPTAVNLRWALEDLGRRLRPLRAQDRAAAAYRRAGDICDEDVAINRAIGENGLALVEQAARGKDGPVNVLTHCNAGWLATVDWGTALAPLYMAHDKGIPIHVWVDETRPRNQGAALTAWELARHGVPHTVIVDNAGGHLMQRGMVDLCITGTDRTTTRGDVCNKIGTYLKALAASDNDVPFYVALPHPTIDWSLADGAAHPDRAAGRGRGADDHWPRRGGARDESGAHARRQPRRQLCLRRDARAARDCAHHRPRCLRCLRRGPADPVSGPRRRGALVIAP